MVVDNDTFNDHRSWEVSRDLGDEEVRIRLKELLSEWVAVVSLVDDQGDAAGKLNRFWNSLQCQAD